MKKLYSQFNRLRNDEVVEPMQVSELEKERIKRNVMKRNKTQLPRVFVVAIITIASGLLLIISVGVSNPALAEKLPIIGNIFDLFKGNEQEYVFDNYDDYASEVEITKESNGVSITITNVVYDKENITIAFTMESERDLGDDPIIHVDWGLKIRTRDNYYLNYNGSLGASQLIEKVEENTYAGIHMIELKAGDHPESIKLNWNSYTIDSRDKEEPFEPIEGNWNFDLSLKAIEREIEKFDNLVTNGEGIEVRLNRIAKTPITTSLHFTEIENVNYQNKNWEAVIINYEVTDDLGNEYKVVWNGASGNNPNVMSSRSMINVIDPEAKSLIITPVVSLYKYKYNDVNSTTGREMELAKEPFNVDPIVVPMEKE